MTKNFDNVKSVAIHFVAGLLIVQLYFFTVQAQIYFSANARMCLRLAYK